MSARPFRGYVAVYRWLVTLYPRTFRHEYGADIVDLFARQLGDEPAVRVWARTIRDLAVTVPLQHLEARMSPPSPHTITVASSVVAGAAGLLALGIGTGPAAPAFVVVGAGAAAVARWSWQASRAAAAPPPSWWKVLATGMALVAVTVVGMLVPWPAAVDLGDNSYWLVVFAFTTSLALIATGLLLGVGTALRWRRTRHTTA